MNKFATKLMLSVGLGAFALLSNAKADSRDQKTIVTFSVPVEIPGHILPAGTYVFKLVDSQSSQNIVQISNEADNHVVATMLAFPEYLDQTADKTVVEFEERPASEPQAVKAWVYIGKNYAHEFVYPKAESLALARANHVSVPSVRTSLVSTTLR